MGKSTGPRFRGNEVKKLRSSACCRQENAAFYPLIHGTWVPLVCDPCTIPVGGGLKENMDSFLWGTVFKTKDYVRSTKYLKTVKKSINSLWKICVTYCSNDEFQDLWRIDTS